MDKKKRLYFSIILSIIMCVLSFFPWLEYEGHIYHMPGFFIDIIRKGGIYSFSGGDIVIYPVMVSLGLSLASGIIYGIRSICLIFGKTIGILAMLPRFMEFVSICIYFTIGGGQMQPAGMMVFGLVVVEAIGQKYLAERDELLCRAREQRAKEILERADERRRMYFPGKYTKDFYQMLWRNYRYNWRNSFLFIASGALSSAFLFVVFALQDILSGSHTKEEFMISGGLQSIIFQAVGLIIVINTFLMSYVFSYYIKNRIVDYQKFTVFGIRRKTMNIMLISEYAGSLAFAFGIGLVLGNILLGILRISPWYRSNDLPYYGTGMGIYTVVFAVYMLISLVAAAANYETYVNLRATGSAISSVGADRLPGKWGYVLLFAGVFACWFGISRFLQRANYENMKYIYYFLLGLFLCILYGTAAWVKRKKKQDEVDSLHMLQRKPFYYRYKRGSRQMFLLAMIHFLVLYVFSVRFVSSLTAEEAKEVYPYDFVCMAYESDDAYFEELKETYGLTMKSIPMKRMTTIKGTPITLLGSQSFMAVFWPQGQNAAIPESAYHELREYAGLPALDGLSLKGEEFHIVYQQDRSVGAHPLDWFYGRDIPNIRAGQPLDNYIWMERENLYPPRSVKSEEIRVLTGVFGRGLQENLLVVSDEYFQSMEVEGPTKMTLITCKENQYQEVGSALSDFTELHKEDSAWDNTIKPCYGKWDYVSDMEAERLLKEVIYGFLIVLLMVSAMFILYIKMAFEIPEVQRRYEFYEIMGMGERQRRATLQKELRPYLLIPLAVGMGGAVLFTAVTWRLRIYDAEAVLGYAKGAGVLWAVYLGVLLVWYLVLEWYVFRETGVIWSAERKKMEKVRQYRKERL